MQRQLKALLLETDLIKLQHGPSIGANLIIPRSMTIGVHTTSDKMLKTQDRTEGGGGGGWLETSVNVNKEMRSPPMTWDFDAMPSLAAKS